MTQNDIAQLIVEYSRSNYFERITKWQKIDVEVILTKLK